MSVIEKLKDKRTVEGIRQDRDILAEPSFTTAQIAQATGVPAETIRTWFKRGVLSLDEDNIGDAAEAIGLGRKFSGYTAMIIAIMGKLTVGSMTAEAAKAAAYKFVFAGSEKRSPCYVFEEGETLLVIPKDAPDGFTPRVVQALFDEDLSWAALYGLFNHRARQIEILRLTELWQSVFQTLGMRAQLEARWSEAG